MNIFRNTCIIVLLIITLIGCNNKPSSRQLFEQDFTSHNLDWQLENDTIVKHVEIGFQEFRIPARVKWLVAKDTNNCLRIAYLELQRLDVGDDVEVANISTNALPCGTQFESDDERRFETVLVSGDFKTKKGIKTYDATIEDRKKTLKDEPKRNLPKVGKAIPELSPLIDQTRKALSKQITPNQPIAELVNDYLLQEWVRNGIDKHRGKRETCGFCGNALPMEIPRNVTTNFRIKLTI